MTAENWDITIGDPVRIVRADKHSTQDSCTDGVCGTDALFECTYTGKSRSITVGSYRFEQGKARLLNDEVIAKRLMSTPGFQVRLTTRGLVQMGRVLSIYVDQSGVETFFDPKTSNPESYDFVVVAPNGALCSAKEIARLDEADKAKLTQQEVDEVMNGEQPYRHKLKMVGKGKWGAPDEL